MFIDALVAGLGMLTCWQTYVAGVLYLLIWCTPIVALTLLGDKPPGGEADAGCLAVILGTVLQVIGLWVTTLPLTPLIFGIAKEMDWTLPWTIILVAPKEALAMVAILYSVALILAIVTVVDPLKVLLTLVPGALILMYAAANWGLLYPATGPPQVRLFPGWLFIAGLLALGGVAAWFGKMAALRVAVLLESIRPGAGRLLVAPIIALFGLIALYVYGAWLGVQLRAAG